MAVSDLVPALGAGATATDPSREATVEIVGAEGWPALAGEWDELLAASASTGIFLTREWLGTWWRHLAGRRRLQMLALRRGRRLVALAPLALAPSRLGLLSPTLQLLGTGQVGSDDLDLLVRPDDEAWAVETLAEELDDCGRLVELTQLPGHSAWPAIGARLADRGWQVVERQTHVCPYVDLAGRTWDEYLASLGPSHRGNFRRRLRQLTRRFEVGFTAVADERDLDPALDALLALHQSRWRERGGSDAFSDRRVVAFHRDFCRQALRRGWLRLFLLRLDGQPAAALYGLLHSGRFSFYQSGFDPAYAGHAVGLVTMGLTIRAAVGEGAREFDLGHGAEAYKFLWANRSRTLRRLDLYPPSFEGRARRRLRASAAAAKNRLRAWVRPDSQPQPFLRSAR